MSLPRSHHVFRYGGEFADRIIESASGTFVRDNEGREILDFTSGQMSGILGHGHPEIVATVSEAIAHLDHVHSSFLTDTVLEFTQSLSNILPSSLSKVLPLSTGAESNEAAIRMAKLVTGNFEIVAFDRSWHGLSAGASAATFNGGRSGYGPALPGMLTLPAPHALLLQILSVTTGGRTRLGVRNDRSPVGGFSGGYDCRTYLELRRNY